MTMPPFLETYFSLHGNTALVTGGTRGIGQAMAIALAEAGADIILIQRDPTFTETAEAIRALDREATIFPADLSSKPSPIPDLITYLTSSSKRVDILLNCAGIQRRHPSASFPTSDWDDVLRVNLSIPFELCRELGKLMLSQEPSPVTSKRGSVINVASLLSFQGGITVPAYAASKGGIAQLTKALSNEWAGRGVAVNAIAPGYVATDMNTALISDEKRAAGILERIPAGRWGTPDDFKGAVVYLASRASAYVSGEILTVDGGWMGR